jgi:hypothetical protein
MGDIENIALSTEQVTAVNERIGVVDGWWVLGRVVTCANSNLQSGLFNGRSLNVFSLLITLQQKYTIQHFQITYQNSHQLSKGSGIKGIF